MRLIVAIVQRQDLEPLLAALRARGYRTTLLASTGGFLGRASVTLLIAVADWQVRVVFQLLRERCHTREEYRYPLVDPGDLAALPPVLVQVGGAVVFVLRLSRVERLAGPAGEDQERGRA